MKRTSSLNELLIEELADLLNAECQLVEALPRMAEASESLTLKFVLEAHLEVSREHIRRIQDIFNNIGQSPQVATCKAMEDLIAQGENTINNTGKSLSRDAAIISVAQRVEQYEITRYGTAHEHAADAGHTMIVEVLSKTLNEERTMNSHLNELAQGMINTQAINPGGFYISKGKFARKGIKKKSKNTDVARFISEGNPNIQDTNDKGKDDQQK